MPLYDKIMLRKRSIIESINDMLKHVAQLVHTPMSDLKAFHARDATGNRFVSEI